jgi:predicted DNA-binding transcriptional regulator AlpA
MEIDAREQVLTEADVARMLGVSAAALRSWRHRRIGPRFCRFGRSVRYLRRDVDEFVARSAVARDDGSATTVEPR